MKMIPKMKKTSKLRVVRLVPPHSQYSLPLEPKVLDLNFSGPNFVPKIFFIPKFFVTLNIFLIVMGLLRPVWLFHDPYNSGKTWHRAGAYLLVDTGFPCITTAFAVLFLALLRATQVSPYI